MNSIRTPRQGVTAKSRRIAEAVDNEEWQKFRLSMKGKSTASKMMMLKKYWHINIHGHVVRESDTRDVFQYNCDICIRVDNYIKALCRGGQLHAGEDLFSVLAVGFYPEIKK